VIDARSPVAPPRRLVRRELRAGAAAVCFLTRVPLGRVVAVDGDDLARSGIAFPVVGALLGALLGAVAIGLGSVLGGFLAGAIAIAAATMITGALHLDALADCADALTAPSRERALEIMRDHAVGAYGAIAIALDLVLKTGALDALGPHRSTLLRTTVAAGALAKAAPVTLSALLPYVRADGLGAAFAAGNRRRAALAALLALALAVAVAGRDGLLLSAVAAGSIVLLGLAFRRWLGGVTGDTLGAAVETTEIAVLLTAVGLAS
jgi:adenosylcobinamide-GDP ribazoletransferase